MAHNSGRRLRRTRRRRRKRIPVIPIFLIIAIVVLMFVFGRKLLSKQDQPVSPSQTAENAAPVTPFASETPVTSAQVSPDLSESPVPTSVTTTITVNCVGDCTLGTDINFDQSTSFTAYADAHGLDYFLSNVSDTFHEDDLTIVNLEGTFTTSKDRADKQFAFKGDPSYTQILTSGGVDACNLANNHSHDYGSQSFTDTQSALADAGLISFGYDDVACTDVNGIKVALIGIYELAKHEDCLSDLEADMQRAKNSGAQLIIVTFHWGIEKETTPNETQIMLAHKTVDLGANLVIGHHPHVLQGIETYKGVNIAYSLGNFCFGGNKNPSDKDTMIYQQTFTFADGELQTDKTEEKIIPCSLSSVSSANDYRPTPAKGDEAERILEKIQSRSSAIG